MDEDNPLDLVVIIKSVLGHLNVLERHLSVSVLVVPLHFIDQTFNAQEVVSFS